MRNKIVDHIDLETAFKLSKPSKVLRAMRESRMDTWAARDAIRRAAAQQDAGWQEEFWAGVRKYNIEL